MVALPYIDWKNSATSIGYFLSKDSQGKGIVTTCIRKLLDYVYDELNLNRVISQCATENIKSRAIAGRLGFVEEGISREGQWLYDDYVDLVTYSFSQREWIHGNRNRFPIGGSMVCKR